MPCAYDELVCSSGAMNIAAIVAKIRVLLLNARRSIIFPLLYNDARPKALLLAM